MKYVLSLCAALVLCGAACADGPKTRIVLPLLRVQVEGVKANVEVRGLIFKRVRIVAKPQCQCEKCKPGCGCGCEPKRK